jgi:beta-glucosidase-like glycosyl hydrolase
LHGVADAGKGIRLYGGSIKGATSFPQVILTSASFDSKLWYQISQVG